MPEVIFSTNKLAKQSSFNQNPYPLKSCEYTLFISLNPVLLKNTPVEFSFGCDSSPAQVKFSNLICVLDSAERMIPFSLSDIKRKILALPAPLMVTLFSKLIGAWIGKSPCFIVISPPPELDNNLTTLLNTTSALVLLAFSALSTSPIAMVLFPCL